MIMFKRALTLALAASFAAVLSAQTQTNKPAPQAQAAKSKAMEMVQGAWVFTTANGQDASAADIVVTITGDKYVQTAGGNVEEKGSFTIDDTKKPMWLTIKILEGNDAGKTQLGVFEVTATTMRGKLTEPDGGSPRPTDFEPAEGYFVFTARKR
jgi:uncharacterized protein (TIGR03067 family)